MLAMMLYWDDDDDGGGGDDDDNNDDDIPSLAMTMRYKQKYIIYFSETWYIIYFRLATDFPGGLGQ